MDPIKVKKLPLEYKLDKELMNLISEANLEFENHKIMSDYCSPQVINKILQKP